MLVGSAVATCMICDEVITLNTAQATCFAQSFDTVLDRISSAPDQRLAVNLNGCSGTDGGANTRGGILSMPPVTGDGSKDTSSEQAGKFVYLLDRNGAECLHSLITAHGPTFDPKRTFDLYEQCQE